MRHLPASIKVSLLSLAISTQITAHAQPNDDSNARELAPVMVTATRSAKSMAEIAGTVYRLERSDIARQSAPGRSTSDVLGQLIPGLAPGSGTTSNYGMTMRGRTVQIMIDGVPLTGSRDGSRQLNSITPEMIERVEVIAGATSIYGAGASGGIINLITRNADDETSQFTSKVGLRTSDHPSADAMAYDLTQTASFNNGTLSGFAGLSYVKQGEIQDSHGDRVGPEIAQTDRQDTQSYDFNGRLGWNIDANQKLSVGLRYFNDEQDSDYGPDYGPGLAALFYPTYEPSREGVKGLYLGDQPRTQHQGLNGQYQNLDILGGQQLTLEAYYRQEKARWFPSVAAVVHPALPNGFSYVAIQSNTDIEVWGVRSALQKQFEVAGRELQLTYGLDFENEQDSQRGQSYDINAFIASNGLNYVKDRSYAMGPDVEIEKAGGFIQVDYALTEHLNLQAVIRRETIGHQVDDSIPYSEAIASTLNPRYSPSTLKGGKVRHSETLFNLGAVYHLTDEQQVFASFSQGFSLPDTQRMLRDVPASFVIDSQNIDPIKVNSYELGWRIRADNGLQAGITAYYNNSDKVVQFNRDYSVSVADTDERIWGAEANIDYPITEQWSLGGTLAYSRGQYKDAADHWRELNAYRLSPMKATFYADWHLDQGYSVRLQSLTIGGTDRAYDDAQNATISPSIRANPAAKIQGYTLFDLIARAPLFGGEVGAGIYNLTDRDYKTVYSQQAEATYGKISSVSAQGRTFALSYSLTY